MSNDSQNVVGDIDATLEKWPKVLPLTYPIEHGKERITSLEFRRGRMGDIAGMRVDGVPSADQLFLIASRMCGKPVAALEQLDPEDGSEVLEIAMTFFAKCLGAGKKQ